jgi:hypothetical protein
VVSVSAIPCRPGIIQPYLRVVHFDVLDCKIVDEALCSSRLALHHGMINVDRDRGGAVVERHYCVERTMNLDMTDPQNHHLSHASKHISHDGLSFRSTEPFV